jgi:hypothetical protein
MRQLRSVTDQTNELRGIPLIRWAAVSSGAVIGGALAILGGSLWAAAAFSSHNSAFYEHLAWWFGGTLIGVAFVGALVAGTLSSVRGGIAGLVNGVSSWALIALATAGVVAVAAIAHGTTSTLVVNHSAISVDLVRPYVAFWTAAAGLGAAAIGGFAGGLVPRRRVADATIDLAPPVASGIPSSSAGRVSSQAVG